MTNTAMDLSKLCVSDFEPLVGEEFSVSAEEGSERICSLSLVEATVQAHGMPGGREPFHLIFQGSPEVPLAQGIVWFEHERSDRIPLFLVPIGASSEKRTYEAVFN